MQRPADIVGVMFGQVDLMSFGRERILQCVTLMPLLASVTD